jgi:hypothetical protein
VLGYGGEGWLWALFGLSHRLLLERPSTAGRECALAGTAAGAYVLREASDYDFALPACWSSSARIFSGNHRFTSAR